MIKFKIGNVTEFVPRFILSFSLTSPDFYMSAVKVLKTLRKGEIADNEQFLLFPQCFQPLWRTFFHFHQI